MKYLDFENLAKNSCDFWQDILWVVSQFCAKHPVWANFVILPIIAIINFLVLYLFFDFLEEKYFPIIRRIKDELKVEFKTRKIAMGIAMVKATRKVVKKNKYLGLLMVPVFLMGKLMKGGKKG